jgi:ferritin-like metal-binding protein YciE
MSTPRNLHDLYVHQLQDLYSAESQLMDALPTMRDNATHPQLKAAFQTHLDQTKHQLERVEQVLNDLGAKTGGHECQAMKGIIKEATSFIKETDNLVAKDAPNPVVDAGLIANAQRAEHYEIAGYGTVCYFAEVLGRPQDKALLALTLQEEEQTDQMLTQIAKQAVNPEALAA